MKIALVEWQDSNIIHGWRLCSEFPGEVSQCRSVGFVLEDTEVQITVALSESSCGSVLETITIPKGCITKIKKLRVR